MRALWTAVPGVFIVAFALREVFRDLFHPTWTGSLSAYVARLLFSIFRRRRATISLAGPLSLVIVILCWVTLLACGFALAYMVEYPGGFRGFDGKPPVSAHPFWKLLYFSLQAMTTLGVGDMAPETDWVRIATCLEALIGFALVTAAVSYIVVLYPALGRVRTLARRVSILIRAANRTGLDPLSGDVQSLIADLSHDVIRTRVDLIHFPILYYFHADHRRSSLASVLPELVHFVEKTSSEESPARVRLAAATLDFALDDLANLLAERFVKVDPPEKRAVFQAYAAHHLVPLRDKAAAKPT